MRVNRWACAIALLAASSAAAQPSSRPDAKVTIAIESTTAPPDWELSVPIAVEVAEGTEVARLSARIVFPAAPLEYVGAKPTETAAKAGFTLKAAAPAGSGDTASVTLEWLPEGQKPARLPSGRIAILSFKVAHDAEEKEWKMTAEEVQAWGPAPASETLAAASKGPATFTVASAGLPIFACFFYMH